MSDSHTHDEGAEEAPRRRGLTSVTLGWLAERMRRKDRIKEQIESGQYRLDSTSIAKSLVNEES